MKKGEEVVFFNPSHLALDNEKQLFCSNVVCWDF